MKPARIPRGGQPSGDARPRRRIAAASFLLLVAIWGTTWAAIRIGLRDIPPFTGAFLRFLLASLVLVALFPRFGVKFRYSASEWKMFIASGLCMFTISYGVVYWAEQWVPGGLASILFATYPLLVVGMAWFLLPGERLGPRALLGMFLGLGGIAIIFSEDLSGWGGPRVVTAALIFLLSPFFSALGNVLVKRWAKGVHPLALTAIPMAIGAVCLGVVAFVVERDNVWTLTPSAAASIAYLALVGTAVAFTLYFWLLSHYSATKLSLITYGTPLVAVLLGTFGMNEPMTWRILLGATTVLSGVLLAGKK